MQRAISMAAEDPDAPGRINTRGSGASANIPSISSSNRVTISAVTGLKCFWYVSYWSGEVANSAPTVNISRCSSFKMVLTSGSSERARAKPMAETASSVIP